MLPRTGRHETTIGQDHVHLEEIVDGEAVAAREIPDAPTQRQAADTSGGDEAAGHRQPERVSGVIDVSPHGAPADADGAIVGSTRTSLMGASR